MAYTPEKKQNTNTENQITNADLAEMSIEELMELQKQAQEAQAGVEREVDSKVETPKPEAKKKETKEEAAKKMSTFQKVGLTLATVGALSGAPKVVEFSQPTRTVTIENVNGVKQNIEVPKLRSISNEQISNSFNTEINKLSEQVGVTFHLLQDGPTLYDDKTGGLIPAVSGYESVKFKEMYDGVIEDSLKNNGGPTDREIELLGLINKEKTLSNPVKYFEVSGNVGVIDPSWEAFHFLGMELAVIRAIRSNIKVNDNNSLLEELWVHNIKAANDIEDNISTEEYNAKCKNLTKSEKQELESRQRIHLKAQSTE
jgi:hypothetical protein